MFKIAKIPFIRIQNVFCMLAANKPIANSSLVTRYASDNVIQVEIKLSLEVFSDSRHRFDVRSKH